MANNTWILVYKTEEEVLKAGYTLWEMDMTAWYTKEGFPVLWPINEGYGHQNNAPIWKEYKGEISR